MIRWSLLLLAAVASPVAAKPAATGIGTSKDCVSLRQVSNQRLDDTGIVLKEGSRWYRNEPSPGCPLRAGRAFSTHTTTNRLCRGDIIDVFEPSSHMGFGNCGLGVFTEIPDPGPQRK